MAELVSRRYAEALFEAAIDLNKLDDFKEEIIAISNVFENENKMKTIFEHPKLSKDEKKDIVNSLFKGRASLEILNFLYILIDKRRENFLNHIKDNYIQLYNEKKQILEGTVTTVVPMKKEEIDRLQKELSNKTGKSVTLINKIEKEILGGVLIRLEDKVIDSSIKGQLENISKILNTARVSEIGVNN